MNSVRVRHTEIYIVGKKVEGTCVRGKGADARVRKETSTRVHAVDSKYDTTTRLRSVFDLNAYSNRIALSRNVLRRAEKRKLL